MLVLILTILAALCGVIGIARSIGTNDFKAGWSKLMFTFIMAALFAGAF